MCGKPFNHISYKTVPNNIIHKTIIGFMFIKKKQVFSGKQSTTAHLKTFLCIGEKYLSFHLTEVSPRAEVVLTECTIFGFNCKLITAWASLQSI